MKKLFFIFLFCFVVSCSGVEFVYKNEKNLINPLYQKTKVATSGTNLSFMNSYLPMFFGESDEHTYNLQINIDEEKTKRSVETNQTTSNLRYELRFNYTFILYNICLFLFMRSVRILVNNASVYSLLLTQYLISHPIGIA